MDRVREVGLQTEHAVEVHRHIRIRNRLSGDHWPTQNAEVAILGPLRWPLPQSGPGRQNGYQQKLDLSGSRHGEASSRIVGGKLWRSEEHTSELQSPCNLVCRLLLD